MKSTGIVRRIDDLGRVVIPKELRDSKNLKVQDSLEIYVDGDKIMFQKYERGCSFCGEMNNIRHFKDKVICGDCLGKMKKIL